jgi:undecaprenyl-diphosphatase
LTALTVLVLADSPIQDVDTGIRNAVRDQATSPGLGWLTTIAQWLADLGELTIAAPVLLLAAAASGARRRSLRPPILALAAIAALMATVIPAKLLIDRVGPDDAPLGPGQWGFFPSGHAATAAICYGAAACLLAPMLTASTRRVLAGVLIALNAAIGWALIWRGYHWFGDVLGAWALSLSLLPVLFPSGLGNPHHPGQRIRHQSPAMDEHPMKADGT